MQQPSTDVDEELLDSREAYADMFASEGGMFDTVFKSI